MTFKVEATENVAYFEQCLGLGEETEITTVECGCQQQLVAPFPKPLEGVFMS